MAERIVEINGVRRSFPSDATDAEIAAALEADAPPPKPQGIIGSAIAQTNEGFRQGMQNTADIFTGFGKAAGSTLWNIGDKMRSMDRPRVPAGAPEPVIAPRVKPDFSPSNTAQKIGGFLEGAAEFALPGAVIPRATGLLGRALQSASEAGSIAGIQTNGDQKAIATTAAVSGVLPLVGPLVKATGTKIQHVALRATAADKLNGYKIANVFKYNVGGSPAQVFNKTGEKIKALAGELKTELAKTPNAELDALDFIAQAQAELKTTGAQSFGRNTGAAKAFETLTAELEHIAPSGKVSITDAQYMKRSLGLLGSWLEGARDPEVQGIGRAANILYSKFREGIEKAALNGKRVNEINKALGELIPIEQVASKSLSKDQARSVIGLIDVVAMAGNLTTPQALWIGVLNRLSKAGMLGNALVKGAEGAAGSAIAPSAASAVTMKRRNE